MNIQTFTVYAILCLAGLALMVIGLMGDSTATPIVGAVLFMGAMLGSTLTEIRNHLAEIRKQLSR